MDAPTVLSIKLIPSYRWHFSGASQKPQNLVSPLRINPVEMIADVLRFIYKSPKLRLCMSQQ